MTPVLIAVVLGTGLLALIPTRRLADGGADRWVVTTYFLALWLLLVAAILVPAARRVAVPVAAVLGVWPWLSLSGIVARLLRRPGRRPPPRNVTPPEAGGPWPP